MDPKNKQVRVRQSPPFKLKDKQGRQSVRVQLKHFGFIPDEIIIEKVFGQSNKFIVMAVLTDAEIKRQEELKVKLKNGQSTTGKPDPEKESGISQNVQLSASNTGSDSRPANNPA